MTNVNPQSQLNFGVAGPFPVREQLAPKGVDDGARIVSRARKWDCGNHEIIVGDCKEVLAGEPEGRFNLVVTSPPYADQRKSLYGGVAPDKYCDWFLDISQELYRTLADDGSFVLNIKEKAVNGERHTYVLELILGMRQQGWRWVEEYIWHKRNCYPGKWPNRFRDSWERLLHFTKSKHFKMRQDEVRVPRGDWADTRLKNMSDEDRRRSASRHKNGFAKNISNWVGRDLVYPTNVLHMATECGYKGHPATFPGSLPEWFIKLFTDKGDRVLDPFMGSGTTLIAAEALGRYATGIEVNPEYAALARERIDG